MLYILFGEPSTEMCLHRACCGLYVQKTKDHDSETVGELSTGDFVNVVELDGRRVRIDAPVDGWTSLISSTGRIFLKKGEEEGISKLHVAAKNGRLDMLRSLIERNCNINLQTETGETPGMTSLPFACDMRSQ